MADNTRKPVTVYDGADVHQAQRLIKGIPVYEGIEHVQSGIHVTIFENGHLLIEGYGNAAHGDPLPGMEVHYDPIAQTMRVQNKIVVRGSGGFSEHEGQFGRPASQTFPVTFTPQADIAAAEALLNYDGHVPAVTAGSPESNSETGRFLGLRGGRGTLDVEIHDPGKLEHSSLRVSYTCPVTGQAMRLFMDENTVHMLRHSAPDAVEQARVEITGAVFAPYDLRHQPGKGKTIR